MTEAVLDKPADVAVPPESVQSAPDVSRETPPPAVESEKPNAPEAPKVETVVEGEKPNEAKDDQEAPQEVELVLPENALVDETAIERAKTFAKDHGIALDKAKDLIAIQDDAVAQHVLNQENEIKANAEKYVSLVKADKELGGDNYNKTVELTRKFFERNGSAPLTKWLDSTGLIYHPELVKMAVKVEKLFLDDGFVKSGVEGSGQKTLADTFYDGKKIEDYSGSHTLKGN